MKFSANLGFLWNDRPLPEAIRLAAKAGFHAVEFHWPYEEDREVVAATLSETGLPALGLNTLRGDVAAGQNGLAALPGHEVAARDAIDLALDWSVALDIANIHVMGGFARGAGAETVFADNLLYACTVAAQAGKTIVIEPLNRHDAPGYCIETTREAMAMIGRVGADNLKLMFDVYHVQRSEGDVITRLEALLPHVGHVQFAQPPHRGGPDQAGELNFDFIFAAIKRLGWGAPLGAEYKCPDGVEASLAWLSKKA
ncbi:MAG: TIM barrel protein [Pseudomonadota bacterium]